MRIYIYKICIRNKWKNKIIDKIYSMNHSNKQIMKRINKI